MKPSWKKPAAYHILFPLKHFIEGDIMEQKDLLLWDEMEIISLLFFTIYPTFSLLFRAVFYLEEWDVSIADLLLFTLSYNWGSVNTGKYKPQSNYKQLDSKWVILNKYFIQLPVVFLLRFGLTDKHNTCEDIFEILITLRSNVMRRSMRQGRRQRPFRK